MSNYDYITIIGECFPDSRAFLPNGKDPFLYTDLVWKTTPIDQAILEACEPLTIQSLNPPDDILFNSNNGTLVQTWTNNSVILKFNDIDTINLAYYDYNSTTGEITIKESGWYKINIDSLIECSQNDAKIGVQGWLEKGGSPSSALNDKCAIHFRNITTLRYHKTIFFEKDDVITYVVSRPYGNKSVSTVENGSQILIERK